MSSKRSSASANPAHHLFLLSYPGRTRRDPARPDSDSPRSACARGAGAACADRHQRCRRTRQSAALHASKSAITASTRTVRTEDRPHTRRVARLRRTLKPENPIAHRLWPAGSGLHDFRTPAGIRNSSGNRPVRLWPTTSVKRPPVQGLAIGCYALHSRSSRGDCMTPKRSWPVGSEIL